MVDGAEPDIVGTGIAAVLVVRIARMRGRERDLLVARKIEVVDRHACAAQAERRQRGQQVAHERRLAAPLRGLEADHQRPGGRQSEPGQREEQHRQIQMVDAAIEVRRAPSRPRAPRPFWPRRPVIGPSASTWANAGPPSAIAPPRCVNRSSARRPIVPGRGAGRDPTYGVYGNTGTAYTVLGILVNPVPQTRFDSAAAADRRPSSAGTSVFDRRYTALAAAVLALAAFNLFFRLGAEIVSEWDESIYAFTAAEMLANGDWIGTTFNGALDYYNTKPPLKVWLIALSFKVFGVRLLPLRLVSALAAWLTVGALMWWARRLAGSAVSLLSGVVLATASRFCMSMPGAARTPTRLYAAGAARVVALWAADARGGWHVAWIGPIVAAAFLLRGMAC